MRRRHKRKSCFVRPVPVGFSERFSLQFTKRHQGNDGAAGRHSMQSTAFGSWNRCRSYSNQRAISLLNGKRVSLAKLLSATGNLGPLWNNCMENKGGRGVRKMPVTTSDISPKP